MGNSEKVTDKHYLQVTSTQLDRLNAALQNALQHAAVSTGTESHQETDDSQNSEKNEPSSNLQRESVGDIGPVTGGNFAKKNHIFLESGALSGALAPDLAIVADAWGDMTAYSKTTIIRMARSAIGGRAPSDDR